MAKITPTKLRQIHIKKFRGLNDITIDIANRITLICGKNGTSKSSILGIAAQVFSFRKDYASDEDIAFKTLTGDNFKSQISEHFRLSKIFDISGSMDTIIKIYDGYTKTDAEFSLKLYNSADRPQPRPVVRGNTTAPGINTSRNATHPVIYLSLKRLIPISFREKYTAHSLQYLHDHEKDFIRETQAILGKFNTTRLTATAGTLHSAVAHSDEYDQDSVSAGEDNIGQLLMAVFSFRKLKEEYPNYKGGLLLIDEADAGLFPAAQIELLRFLNRECKRLDLQVVMTSHSPTMIELIHESNQREQSDNKTVYLTDSYGPISIRTNFSWPEIYADLHQETRALNEEISFPVVNIYFEDRECADLYSAIITSRPINRITNKLKDIALGCDEYKKLIDRKVPEFTSKGIIILDGDVDGVDHLPSVIKLPSILPPDQMIFEMLLNTPAEDRFWTNKNMYTRQVFLKSARGIIEALELPIHEKSITLSDYIQQYSKNKKANQRPLRELFKDFAHDSHFCRVVNGPVGFNPYRIWVKRNEQAANEFREAVVRTLKSTLVKGFGLDAAKVSVLG
ncbi:ATP-binding protein [Pseudomonas entomophila]|uniref:ATP-dependent nuclease n=1 Tax=Pseudomonas entomophila TaxID=312306 RepID=UPI0015E3E19F|nr:AAA family ATPase [Pseudomonas entomophila]MBA1194496.1 ATP-binding protein [Pseudomonas entomophila]